MQVTEDHSSRYFHLDQESQTTHDALLVKLGSVKIPYCLISLVMAWSPTAQKLPFLVI